MPAHDDDLPRGVTRHMARRAKKKGYFFKGFSVDTNELAISSFKQAVAKMGLSNIRILDQKSMNNEQMATLLFVWCQRALEQKGIAWFEQEFAPIVEMLNPIVAKEKALADALEAQEEARAKEAEEGFSGPKKGAKKGTKKKPPGSQGGK